MVLIYGTYLPVTLVVLFVLYTVSYICDSMHE